MNNILHLSVEQIAKISILLSPIIPGASNKVLDALKVKKEDRNLSFLNNKNIINQEVVLKDFDILFKKIEQ